MRSFEIEFTKDLLEINERLKYEKDESIKTQLLKDKKYILKYLGHLPKPEVFTYQKHLNESDVVKFLSCDQMDNIKLKNIRIFNLNHKKMLSLTKKFIDKPKFKLYKVYSGIIEHEGLKFVREDSEYLGSTTYIKSLDKNYIKINKQNKISMYAALIHELGHARSNNICNTAKHCFGETYPIFLELVFSDWLKKNGLIKEAYNLKMSLLIQVKKYLNELCDELRNYLYRSEDCAVDNFVFEYKYYVLKNIILALYIYDMYLSNEQETLIKIDYFILNSNKMTEAQLLNIFGIDNSMFDNSKKILKKIYDDLNKEQLVTKK